MSLSDKIEKIHTDTIFYDECFMIEAYDVKEAVQELIKSFQTTGVWTREGALEHIKEIFGEELTDARQTKLYSSSDDKLVSSDVVDHRLIKDKTAENIQEKESGK